MAIVTVTAHLQLQPGPGRGLGVEVCLAGVVGLVEAEHGVVSGQRGELLAPVAPDHGHEACTQHTVLPPSCHCWGPGAGSPSPPHWLGWVPQLYHQAAPGSAAVSPHWKYSGAMQTPFLEEEVTLPPTPSPAARARLGRSSNNNIVRAV